MQKQYNAKLNKVIQIDESQIQDHLGKLVSQGRFFNTEGERSFQ